MKRIKNVYVPLSGVMQGLTLHVRVTGATVMRWRLKAGVLVLKLAARVIGCQFEIDLNK